MFQIILILNLLFSLTCSACEDFLFQGKPIPSACLENFFCCCLFNEDELEISSCFTGQPEDRPSGIFEWDDVGMLFDRIHVIRMYSWEEGAMSKFSAILLIERVGEKLKLLDIVSMGDRHSSLITSCTIENDQIHYTQNATQESLFYEITKHFPELESHCIKSGLCSGEAGFVGRFKHIATITSEGHILENTTTHFEFSN